MNSNFCIYWQHYHSICSMYSMANWVTLNAQNLKIFWLMPCCYSLQTTRYYNPEDCTVNIINTYSKVTIYENRWLFIWHDFKNNLQYHDAFRFVAMNIQKPFIWRQIVSEFIPQYNNRTVESYAPVKCKGLLFWHHAHTET